MNEPSGQSGTTERTATVAEVRDAIEVLSQADSVRLRNFAQNRIALIGTAGARRSIHELLQEAVTRVLSGSRRWNPDNVRFVQLLIGIMRSISSHWARDYKPELDWLASEAVSVDKEGNKWDPVKESGSTDPPLDRAAATRLALEPVEAFFEDDEEAYLVIQGWREGMNGPEIQGNLGLSKAEYETVVRRIRRNALSQFGGEYVQ